MPWFDLDAKDEEAKLEGIIPVGGYPTSLVYSPNRRKLFIADGRNLVTGPSSAAQSSDEWRRGVRRSG